MALIVPDEKRMFWTTLYIQARAAPGGGHSRCNELMLCAAPPALAAPGVGAVFAHLPAEGVAGVPYAVPGAWHARGELHNRFACTCLNSASLPRCGPTQMGFMMSMTNAIGFYKSSKGTNAQDAVPLLVSSPEADTLSTLPQRQGPRSAPGCQDSLPSMCAAACSDDTMRSAPTCQSNPVSHSGCLSVSSRNLKHACTCAPCCQGSRGRLAQGAPPFA